MVDPRIYTEYYNSVKACSQAAQRDFMKVWALLDFDDLETAKLILLDLLPGLVEKYGDAAAEAAAEMYEAVCLAETGKRTTAELAKASQKKVRKSVHYASTLMAAGAFDKAFGVLRSALDYHVKKPARDTVERNAKRDGIRWARVPQGTSTCAWCIMLASRGFVYHDEDLAKESHGYHEGCDCLPVPSTKKNTVCPGYEAEDRARYLSIYKDARKKVEGSPEWIAFGQQQLYEEQTKLLVNQIRLDIYPERKDAINAQRRQRYAEQKKQK